MGSSSGRKSTLSHASKVGSTPAGRPADENPKSEPAARPVFVLAESSLTPVKAKVSGDQGATGSQEDSIEMLCATLPDGTQVLIPRQVLQ